jgi:hypothetical protein
MTDLCNDVEDARISLKILSRVSDQTRGLDLLNTYNS